MSPGIVVLALAVLVAVGFGLHRRRVDGRFADGSSTTTTWSSLAAVMPHARLGERATLVQFSSAFCAPCRTTRVVLGDVADRVDGVVHLEVDAEEHLDVVRELDVRRTPTTLILDATGAEITRAAGAPRREQVLAALPTLSQEF
ncbi:TlpA family protein disulfide reductase [Nocardioides vastitatis]|uniref:TlpA family protein disulfide reductase n=2 Tax=Nocardioides TaxID=1839 RepID=A0ABW0Z8W6_9ACTN|nr:thioredoxin family protein [Nocardioides sp.]